MLNCSIIGLGYIGLPTATIIAKNGIKVNGIDTNKEVVESVNNSIPHIKEKGIENNLKEAISTGNFRAFSSPQESDIYIFAVPTPTKEENNSLPNADTSLLIKAFKSVMPLIKKNDLIIIESTSPVGTTKKISEIFFDNTNFEPKDIHFVYCPERVIPGNMLTELVLNDRVIGGLTEEATNLAVNFYAKFCKGKLFKTSASSAEFVKLAENAYRDVNIAFANELSIVAKNLELDILELISLANRHPRVKILNPGCGVGGHCIAVDPWFLASASPKNTPLIQTARKVNDNKLNWVFEQILSEIKKIETNLGRKPIVGCFGIAFKADVDDLRGSPAISIINKLINEGIEVLINEPNLKKHTTFKLFSIQDILKKSDLNVFLVNHTEYQNLHLNNNNLLDFCGIKK